MAKPKKPIVKSSTTQNVAIGAAGGASLGYVVAEILANMFAKATGVDVPPEITALVAGIISTIVIPLLSRKVAAARRG